MASDKMTKEEKKVLTIWGIVLVGVVVTLLIVNHFIPIKTLFAAIRGESTELKEEFGIVSDFSRYSTVSGTIEKMYSYIDSKDTDALLKILNEDYVYDNNISKNNIDEFLTFSDRSLTFITNIMYRKQTRKGTYIYVVDGDIVYSHTGEVVKKEYYQVILDGNHFLFNIKPITQEEYEGVRNE